MEHMVIVDGVLGVLVDTMRWAVTFRLWEKKSEEKRRKDFEEGEGNKCFEVTISDL